MICILIFLELWVLWKKCKHNVYLQLCYFCSHNFSPRIKLNKTQIFCSISLLSFTEMFINNPPYHNTKNKGSRDGMTGRKNGKRTIQTNAPLISPGLSEYYCSHALIWKKKIKFKIFPYCTGIIVKVYRYYFIYTLHKIHHYESES